jgi:uncharacterized membrane protein
MSFVYTVFNCGTNFHRNSPDVVAKLWKLTPQSECMINDGVGSGSWKPNLLGGRSNPGGASKIGGLLFGVGMDANVEGTIQTITALKPLPRIVNMVGWSRGGVTCAKIANMMWRMGPPLSLIAVNIYAIDPVPGSNSGGGHMWKNIEINQNVRYYHAMLSQHDKRGLDDFFEPTYPSFNGSTKIDVDIMPGTHSSILVFKGKGNQENAELVYGLAYRFLKSHGSRVNAGAFLTNNEILLRYAAIQENFAVYTKLKGKQLLQINELKRNVMDSSKTMVGGLSMGKPGFFINEHHRETFRFNYPSLTNEIDSDPPAEPFADSTASYWGRELDRLMVDCVPQAKQVLLYSLSRRTK